MPLLGLLLEAQPTVQAALPLQAASRIQAVIRNHLRIRIPWMLITQASRFLPTISRLLVR
jgi:hypothetical protein